MGPRIYSGCGAVDHRPRRRGQDPASSGIRGPASGSGMAVRVLRAGRGGQAIAAITARGERTLLVVDYAEARTDLEVLLKALAAHDGQPVIRVLLLARTLGEWWQPDGPLRRHAAIRDVLASAEAVELSPLTVISLRQREALDGALKAFAGHYGMPVPATTLRQAAKDTPILLLHTAALTAVLEAREGTGTAASVGATEEVVGELLGHEDNYWSQTATAHGLDQLGVGPGTRRQAVPSPDCLALTTSRTPDRCCGDCLSCPRRPR